MESAFEAKACPESKRTRWKIFLDAGESSTNQEPCVFHHLVFISRHFGSSVNGITVKKNMLAQAPVNGAIAKAVWGFDQ